jgi:dihydroorotate dehydrogenase (fumarate)
MGAGLRTRYMGLDLPSPLVVSACPLSRDVNTARRLQDAGAGAIVLFSLFEEQFRPSVPDLGSQGEPADALEFGEFLTRPHAYLDHIRRLKDTLDIPVIASLNASAPGPWLDYAASLENAGADALEVGIYRLTVDPDVSGAAIEEADLEIYRRAREAVSIPVAVKLAPYFTNTAAVAKRFDEAGADALVLFNRFYQPMIDIERRQMVLGLELSTAPEASLPILWISILKGQIEANLAATSGIHSFKDVVRAIMAGADVAMLCSVLLRHGVDRMADIHRLLQEWLEAHEHTALADIRGVMSMQSQLTPENAGRAGYTKILNRYW